MKGAAYRLALSCYHGVLMTKNLILNLIDPPVVILIYHRVTTLSSDTQQLAVSPENFRAQMQFLKSHYSVVRFEDDWSGIREPVVVVTFDDGYSDNVLEALPILEEVGVPATFFVSTDAIGTCKEFWWDELERVILFGKDYPPYFILNDNTFGRIWPTLTVPERKSMYDTIHTLIKKINASQRAEWFRQLRDWAKLDRQGRAEYRSMTVDELKTLAGSSWVTIGAHTVTHTPLSTLPVMEQRDEIRESRRQLGLFLGMEIKVFSYPFGTIKDYDKHSVRICREVGFVKAASNFPGQAHRWTDPFQLPRQLVRNWDVDTFASKMERFLVL